MSDIGYPIIEKIKYDSQAATNLEDAIDGDKLKRKLLIEYPTVYVICSPIKSGGFKVYVGGN